MTELVAIDAEPVERSGAQILDVVSTRVADVGTELQRLDQLIGDLARHETELEKLADAKTQILEDRDISKEQRVSKMMKVLASLEIEASDFNKKKSEIAGQREHIREIGITARGFIGHVFDGLRASRLTRARAFIDEFFYQRPMGIPSENLAGMSNLVREVDLLSHGLVHPQPNLEAELTALRGLDEQWSVLRGLAEVEPGFTPELPESWL